MKLNIKIFIVCSLFMSISTVQASYIVVTPDNQIDNLSAAKKSTHGQGFKRSHIIVSGRPGDLAANPMISALAQGLRFQKLYPNDLVILYLVDTPKYNKSTGHDDIRIVASDSSRHYMQLQKIFNVFGFKTLESSNETLNAYKLIAEMQSFYNIASFDAFGHSGISPGIFLDSVKEQNSVSAWQPFDSGLNDKGLTATLKSHFTADAYAYIHGCNGGHLSAQWMAKTWGIPVAGNFTSAHFEVDWNAGAQGAPPKYMWSNESEPNLDFMKTMRMKSDDVDYEGYYGSYSQGLPIYKFFCVGIDDNKCQKGMAKSVLAIVTTVHPKPKQSPQAYYEEVLREYLCPSDQYGKQIEEKKFEVQAQCIRALESATSDIHGSNVLSNKFLNYMPYRGKRSMECLKDHSACYDAYCYTENKYKDKKFGDSLLAMACAQGVKLNEISTKPADRAPGVNVRKELDGLSLGSSSFMDEYFTLVKAFDQIKDEVPEEFMNPTTLPDE